jgi:radical SAM superfamily enzyme YgiQ (UPF0313 family)
MPHCRVSLCDLTHTSQQIALNCMPLGVGCIAACAKLELGDAVDVELFKYPDDFIARFRESPPHVVGFTNYIWNADLSYSLAKRIKAIRPQTVVVFGGPNYPNEESEQLAFLRPLDAVDFYVYKEGERPFAALLRALIDADFDVAAVKRSTPKSCHFIHDGQLKRGELMERVRSLAEIPSPYTEGMLDKFFDGRLVPLIQTNRGCPFSCTFCVEGLTYYNKVAMAGPERARSELHYIAERYAGSRMLNIADSNFGMYKEDLEVAQAIGEIQQRYGWPEYIHVATGKNQKERVLKVASLINGALRLSGSVQTLDAAVLKNIKRSNISADKLMVLAQQAADVGSNVYSEIILGLPGENKASHVRTIDLLVNAGFNFLRPYTLMMLDGTELADQATRTAYGMETRFRVLPRCFGSYAFDTEPVNSVEIEEVCVATKDLTFEDYLECRRFHLTIELFYNDRVFQEVIEFLKLHGIPASSWLKAVHARMDRFPEDLLAIYCGFSRETQNELWESREELEAFAKRADTITRYVSGELGSNLSFKYKARALLDSAASLHAVAYAAAGDLLASVAPDALARYAGYLAELRRFSEAVKSNLMDTSQVVSRRFAYDFGEIAARKFESLPDEFARPEGLIHYFFHDRVQREMIATHLRQYGRDLNGLTRILSKVYVKHLYRKHSTTPPSPELEAGTVPVPAESRLF